MAWIVVVPPSPATRTSATRCATRKASGSARLASSLPGARRNVEKRILPTFGDIPLGDLDQAPSAHAAPARTPPGSAAMATTVDATGTVAILHHGDASLLVDLAVKAKDASPFSGSGDARCRTHRGWDRPTPRPEDGDTRRCVQFWMASHRSIGAPGPTDHTEPARVIDTLKKRPEYGHIHDTDDFDQHFLVNLEAIEELVGAAELRPGDRVLEIGCGTGNITRPLAASGAAVIGYEVDERLRRRLYDVERLPNVTIHYRDFLTVNLIQPFDKVVSNPPFSLVEPMFKRFAFTQPTPWMTLVLGQTFSASARAAPDEPQYNRTSLLTQACWEVRQLAELSVADFQPPPRTPAAILQFEPAPERRDAAIRKLVAKAFVRQAGIRLRDLLALVSSRSRSSERIPPDTLRARIPRDLLNRRLQQIPNEALGLILTAILDAHREADQ